MKILYYFDFIYKDQYKYLIVLKRRYRILYESKQIFELLGYGDFSDEVFLIV